MADYGFLGKDSKLRAALERADQKQQEMQEKTDAVLKNPLRAAALAALAGRNPISAATSGEKVTPQQISNKLWERMEETGMPLRAPGQAEFPLERPTAALIENATDPELIGSLAQGTVAKVGAKPNRFYKDIASNTSGGGIETGGNIPRNQIVNELQQARNVVKQPEPSLQSPEVISGLDYKLKIQNELAKRRAMRELKDRGLTAEPLTWFDLAKGVRTK